MMQEWVFQVQEIKSNSYSLQGKGGKNLWIICSSQDLTAENDVQLKAIIQAIKYDVDSDCIIVKLSDKMLLSDILDRKVQNLIVFGIMPEWIGFNIDMEWYTPIVFENFTAIFSESLEALSKDKSKKAKLWNALKKVFLDS